MEKHVRVCIEHGRDGENETKFKQDRKPNSSRGVPNNLDRVITQKRELRRVRGRAAAIFPRENFIARPRVHRVRTRHANYYVWYIAVKFSVETLVHVGGPRFSLTSRSVVEPINAI